jgi:hypothetical protein
VGSSWIAHGKDPNFPAWTDTAQLDYRTPATRAAMRALLQSVATQCDGVRCDMAMLLLEDVFTATWANFPREPPLAYGEFWREAIAAVKQRRAEFLFVAEAYWNREGRLQELGFDYVYDKGFYDALLRRDPAALWNHLRHGDFSPVRFLENHDEPRIASLLNFSEHKAAAVLLLSQPGMRLLHDGQLTGRRHRLPVQFSRYWPESPDPPTKSFYASLLASLPQTDIGGADMEYLDINVPGCFLMKWAGQTTRWTLVAVNLDAQPRPFALEELDRARIVRTVFAAAEVKGTLAGGRLQIELPPQGYGIFTVEP